MNWKSRVGIIRSTLRIRLTLFLGVFGLVSVFCAVGFLVAWVEATTEPLVTVDRGSLDIGTQWANPGFRWNLPIRNTTHCEVTLHKLVTSCGCAQITDEAVVIPAGTTAQVRLKLNLTGGARDERAQSWPFEADISPLVSVSGRATQPRLGGGPWRLRGRVRRLFEVSPAVVDCSEGFVQGEPLPERTVHVTCLHPVASLTAVVDPPQADASLEQVESGGERSSFVMRVKVFDSVPVGDLAAGVQLKAVLVGGLPVPPFEVPVRGRVLPEVYPVPSSVALAATAVGNIVEVVLQFQSHGRRAFDISVGRSTHEDLSVVGLERSDGLVRCRVRVSVTEPGDHQGELSFSLRVEGRDVSELAVPVRWYGIEDKGRRSSAVK